MNWMLLTLLLVSSNLWAIADAQLLYGIRQSKIIVASQSETLTGNSVRFAAHIDPIPFVPVAIGAFYMSDDLDTTGSSKLIPQTTLTGYQIGIDTHAWLPLGVFDLSPFVRASMSVFGDYRAETSDFVADGVSFGARTSQYSASGHQIGLGLRWNPIAIVSAMVQVDMVSETYKSKSVKIGGVDFGKDADFKNENGMIISFGLQAGI
jgi:hypothetical protein